MREQVRTWSAFAACALLLLGAMSFVTVRAVSLERAEARARAETHRQETIRLALWRMDSWMTALIAREAARPWFHYHSFFSAERPYSTIPGDTSLDRVRADEQLAASPLLLERPEGVRLYFQVANGQVTSPQTVDGGLQGLALLADAKPAEMEKAQTDLAQIRRDIEGTPFGISLGLRGTDLKLASPPDFYRGYADAKDQPSQTNSQIAYKPQAVPPPPNSQNLGQQELQKQNDYSVRQQIAESASQNITTNSPNRTIRRSEQDEKLVSKSERTDQSEKLAVRSGGAPALDRDAGGSSKVADKAVPAPVARKEAAGDDAKGAEAPTEKDQTFKKTIAKDDEARSSKNKVTDPAPAAAASTGSAAAPGAPAAPSRELGKVTGDLQKVDPPRIETTGFAGANPVVSSPPQADPSPLSVACSTIPSHPQAAGPELFLTRHIASDTSVVHQAIWLDWPALRAGLLGTIKDLASDATLELVPQATASIEPADASSRMASIPARLTLGQSSDAAILASFAMPAWSPTRTGLLIGWAAILAALAAIGLVLRANVQLSERRGRFVSAVTHELRTPLTTFTLYSQMLADGIITDETARHEYHLTLKSEAQRLSRIVESVLDYARLGTRSGGVKIETIPAADLVARVLPSLSARAADGGMEFVTSIPSLEGILIRGDHNSAERVLLNLIDNASKYAQSATDRRVHLLIAIEGKSLSFIIADHGPGIAPEDETRIFSPFQRGKAQASGNTPGLGLGLAFARTLAQDLGGELSLVSLQGFGAAFDFRLKIAQSKPQSNQ